MAIEAGSSPAVLTNQNLEVIMAQTESESRLQRRCQEIIKDAKAFVFKTHGSIFIRAGMPDLIACVPTTEEVLRKMLAEGWFKNGKIGLFVGFETKREDRLNELSDAQRIVGEEIRDAGGIWYAIDDSDLVQAMMKMIGGKM